MTTALLFCDERTSRNIKNHVFEFIYVYKSKAKDLFFNYEVRVAKIGEVVSVDYEVIGDFDIENSNPTQNAPTK